MKTGKRMKMKANGERKITLHPVPCIRCKGVFDLEHVPSGDWICGYCRAEMDARIEHFGNSFRNDMEARRLEEDYDGDIRNRQEAQERKAMIYARSCFLEPGDFDKEEAERAKKTTRRKLKQKRPAATGHQKKENCHGF